MSEKMDITCGLCSGAFKQPRAISCFHIFCKDCLAERVDQQLGMITCPKCQTETIFGYGEGVESLMPDYGIMRVMEIQNNGGAAAASQSRNGTSAESPKCGFREKCDKKDSVVIYCQQCSSYLCSQCMDIHTDICRFRDHVLEPVHSGEVKKLTDLVSEAKQDMPPISDAVRTANEDLDSALKQVRQDNDHVMAKIPDQERHFLKDLEAAVRNSKEALVDVGNRMVRHASATDFGYRLLTHGSQEEIAHLAPLLISSLKLTQDQGHCPQSIVTAFASDCKSRLGQHLQKIQRLVDEIQVGLPLMESTLVVTPNPLNQNLDPNLHQNSLEKSDRTKALKLLANRLLWGPPKQDSKKRHHGNQKGKRIA